MTKGDELWVWQEQTPSGWGLIVMLVPAVGVAGPLASRDRGVAEVVFGPSARERGRSLGMQVRLAHFALVSVEAEVDPE